MSARRRRRRRSGWGKRWRSCGKDPNQVREFDTSKEGEGEMKERGRNDEMKGMEDEKAGFGSLGQEKKEGGKTR